MIKKIMSLLIIGILATGMIGCSNKKSDKEDKEIIVDRDTREGALKPLERMLELGK